MSNSLISNISKGIIPLLMFLKTYGQNNLVPNFSFELYTICPKIVGVPAPPPNLWSAIPIKGIQFLNTCANISAPQLGVPYNDMGSINNYQPAHSGNSYCAFVGLNTSPLAGNYGGKRHYFQVELTDSLKKNKKYNCGFYVALSNGANYGINNIAMAISKSALTVDTSVVKNWVINTNPQIYNFGNPIIKDTQNWILIHSIFIAQGGEQYITIGNFKDNASTSIDRDLPPSTYDWAVYMLDDVFVYELNNSYCALANAGRDTTIHIGDSAFIGSYINGIDSIKWYANGTTLIDSIQPGFWVKPQQNTFYVLQQTVNGCFSADTVWVNVQPLPLKFLKYELRFTNGEQVENRWQTANEINVSHFYVQRATNGRDFKTIGKVSANGAGDNEYSFVDNQLPSTTDQLTLYYRILSVDKDGKTNYSEVRNIEYRTRNNELRIFPNPAKDVVTVSCRSAKTLRVINSLGQIVQQLNHATEQQIINIKQLSQGLYMVQITKANGTIETIKFIKE